MSENTVFDFDDEAQDIGNTNNTDVYFDAELYPNEDLETIDLDHPAFHDDNVNPEERDVNGLDFSQGGIDLDLLDDLVAEDSKHDDDGEQHEVATLEAMLAYWEGSTAIEKLITNLDGYRAELSDRLDTCDEYTSELNDSMVDLGLRAAEVCSVVVGFNLQLLNLNLKVDSTNEHLDKINNHSGQLSKCLSEFNDRTFALMERYVAFKKDKGLA